MKTGLLTKTISSLIILQSIFPYSGIVSAMVAVEPTPNTISCPQLNPPAPDSCPNGEWVQQDIYTNGCPKSPVCVVKTEPEKPTCPMYAMVMPTCLDDQAIISGETDSNGCPLPPRCKNQIRIDPTSPVVTKLTIDIEDLKPVVTSPYTREPIQSAPGNLIMQPTMPQTNWIVQPESECNSENACQTISVKRVPDGGVIVNDGTSTMSTSTPIQIENSTITITTDAGNNPVILPSLVQKIIETDPQTSGSLPSTIGGIKLTACAESSYSCDEHAGIYKVQSEKETKLFGLLPIMSTINYEVSASKGTILSTEKPWYLNILPFLFTW